MTNWYKEIKAIANKNGEKIIECTLSEDELHKEFDDGYGGTEGSPFTAWSENWVYFPLCYDGAEWVGCAPRNPCGKAMEHQGGG
jgi:hypothetical protein